jgi:UDP-3-O-[3-hydroxymyristoyl] glucosamine N-acyltransferase
MSPTPLCEQTLGGLARHCDAVLRGEPTVTRGVAALGEAGPDEISFLANSRYKGFLESTRAAAVILSPAHADDYPIPRLNGDNPDLLRARAMGALYPASAAVAGVHASAVLGKDVRIDPTAEIAAGCVLGDRVAIGSGVIIGPNSVLLEGVSVGRDSRLVASVTLGPGTQLGERCLIHPGAVIGAALITGHVELADDVHVFGATTITRSIAEPGVYTGDLPAMPHATCPMRFERRTSPAFDS